ncbi:hypothetical protein CI238_11897 [Colletotrichum incanum]|uniref:Uncharacterized protein n=1 Tax=Colletotrichum incanum TaxID=1573173 RepID=A0A161WBF2_COLIC|nr:hypothetical protein CI238_11897 [Colletotrichum incanum]
MTATRQHSASHLSSIAWQGVRARIARQSGQPGGAAPSAPDQEHRLNKLREYVSAKSGTERVAAGSCAIESGDEWMDDETPGNVSGRTDGLKFSRIELRPVSARSYQSLLTISIESGGLEVITCGTAAAVGDSCKDEDPETEAAGKPEAAMMSEVAGCFGLTVDKDRGQQTSDRLQLYPPARAVPQPQFCDSPSRHVLGAEDDAERGTLLPYGWNLRDDYHSRGW